jgi:hypothetical protein
MMIQANIEDKIALADRVIYGEDNVPGPPLPDPWRPNP